MNGGVLLSACWFWVFVWRQDRARDLRHLPRPAVSRLNTPAMSQLKDKLARRKHMTDKEADKYSDIFLQQVKFSAYLSLRHLLPVSAPSHVHLLETLSWWNYNRTNESFNNFNSVCIRQDTLDGRATTTARVARPRAIRNSTWEPTSRWYSWGSLLRQDPPKFPCSIRKLAYATTTSFPKSPCGVQQYLCEGDLPIRDGTVVYIDTSC